MPADGTGGPSGSRSLASMTVLSRADLLAEGWTARQITDSVRAGTLIRARRGAYVAPDAPRDLVEATRVGGLVGCVSALRMLEIFVFSRPALHVHMVRGASRMRSPGNRSKRLAPRRERRIVLHWHPLRGAPADGRVSVVDALIHSVRCQPTRHAIASIDSALNKGLLRIEELSDVFDGLPARYQMLRRLVDGRAQAGTETLVRLMVIGLGCAVELQAEFEGVGFVDLVVDGWLVIECDSKEFHSDWAQQLKDYRRDLELARRGYCVLRLTAEDILYRPEVVLASIRGILGQGGPRR